MQSIDKIYETRAKFASENIAKGGPVIALVYRDGVLILTTNPNRSFHKIRELHSSIAFAGMGNKYVELNDLHTVLNGFVLQDSSLFSDEDISAVFLSEKAASIVSSAFRDIRAWPFESEFLIAEISSDEECQPSSIFHIAFDGGVQERSDFVCLGGKEAREKIESFLAENYKESLYFEEALSLAKTCLEMTRQSNEVSEKVTWEAAVLDKTQKGLTKFRHLNKEEVEECLKSE